MLGYRILAELGHLAQHRPAAPGGRARLLPAVGNPGQGLQSGAHRIRVGVVSVVDHRDPVGAGGHLHPVPRYRACRGKRVGYLLDAGTALQRDRARAQRVRDLMIAVHPELDLRLGAFGMQRKTRPGQFVQRHAFGPDVAGTRVGVGRAADPDHPGLGELGHRGDSRVVYVEDDRPRC